LTRAFPAIVPACEAVRWCFWKAIHFSFSKKEASIKRWSESIARVTAFASSLDQIGPMTKTVEDAAILLGVLLVARDAGRQLSTGADPAHVADSRRKVSSEP